MSPTARPLRLAAALFPALALAACAHQVASTTQASAPGFLLGLWHGFIFPVAAVASFFVPDIAVYALPNNGTFYDLGYFIGIVFLGVGANRTKKVYVERTVIRREQA